MNKKNILNQHKLLALISCSLDTLDDLKANSKDARDMYDAMENLEPFLKKAIDDSFLRSKYLASSTVINDMHKKFDTVVRKTYNEHNK